jgi:hypothetical protein
MTQLSNVPLSNLLTTEGWLTGKHGEAGTILGIHSKQSGIFFEVYLEIQWDTGNKAFPKFPEECIHITVNEEWQPKVNHEFAEYQQDLLQQNMNYVFRSINVERMIELTTPILVYKKNTDEHNTVDEQSA